jgi:outer membrane protein assembly factor BamE (lipoprotein component of BamABCDE complex)
MTPTLRFACRFTAVAVLCLCASACGSKVNKGNFERIEVGMSESDVEGILGSPSQTIPGLFKVMVWEEEEYSIRVIFQDGKVVSKVALDVEAMKKEIAKLREGNGAGFDPSKFVGGNTPGMRPNVPQVPLPGGDQAAQKREEKAPPAPEQEKKPEDPKPKKEEHPFKDIFRPGQKPPAYNQPAVNAKFTRANFDRLQVGMTEAQVKAIFGSPNRSSSHADPLNAKVQKTYFYYSAPGNKNSSTLEFTDGKLAAKFWYGN